MMKNCVSLFSVWSLVLLFPFSMRGADPSKEQPFVQIERMTVRLEMKNPAGNWVSQGTGFFVNDEKDNIYIVTARHVVTGSGKMHARVPSINTVSGKTEMVYLEMPPDLWTLGDDDDKSLLPVDVAVMRLGSIEDRKLVSFSYCPTKCSPGVYNQVADDPHPLDQIMVLGFPYDLGFTLKEQRPMVRLGVVSFGADEPFIKIGTDPRFLRKGAFIIDCHIFPGNSGGPVILMNPLQPSRLGGLITGSIPQLEFGFVTPASEIRQVLDKAASASPNMNAWFTVDPDAVQPAK
jgi:S1-C subfamily serine protease